MAKDRRAMANPFAGIKKEEVPAPREEAERGPVAAPQLVRKETAARSTEQREFVGFRLHPALLERARAVAWTHRLTLTAYVEEAIEKAVASAERENGGPFPPVPRRRRSV